MSSSVSSWLGATKPDDEAEDKKSETREEKEDNAGDAEPKCNSDELNEESNPVDVQQQFDEMGQKAVNAAKEWGCKTCEGL